MDIRKLSQNIQEETEKIIVGKSDRIRLIVMSILANGHILLDDLPGVGKTTLLRLLLGLETPDEGSVRLPENCRWAAVFQEDRLLEHLDAWGNLHLIGTRQGEARAAAMLAELGLAETAERPVREYSGGMRRRLALIRALLAPSDALALDEPFSGLDDENRAVCRAVLQRETVGKPVLLVTHDEDDAAGLDARIIRLAPAR